MINQTFRRFAVIASLFGASLAAPALASESRSQELVDAAIVHYDDVGREAAFADFMETESDWVEGEFYVIVAEADSGVFKAHAINPKLIDNEKLWDLQDVNKKFIIRDMVESGKTAPDGGWTEYVWTNPATKKLANKRTYVRKHDELLFMVGYYE